MTLHEIKDRIAELRQRLGVQERDGDAMAKTLIEIAALERRLKPETHQSGDAS